MYFLKSEREQVNIHPTAERARCYDRPDLIEIKYIGLSLIKITLEMKYEVICSHTEEC